MVYIPAIILKYYNKGIRKAYSFKGFIKELLRYIQMKLEENQQKRIMEHSDRVIVFSQNVKNQISDGKICDLNKVQICYPGVSKKISSQRNPDADVKIPVFLFVGRLVAEKNLDMLLEAFSLLSCKGKKLIIVGDGVLAPYLKQLAFELGIANNVIFTGETKIPESYYQQADFFVIPSKYESFGQVIVESMTAGVPVIGFRTIPGKTLTAVDELVEDQKTGFVCNSFDKNALHDCLAQATILYQNQQTYHQMRESCVRFAEENFSWKRLADSCITK
jgi:glycosyltransferase involved in cell wall biosynthesis